jgi:hypothetical protein
MPASDLSGRKVVVTGTGFAQGAMVKFGGLPAQVTSTTNTTIEAITPAGAGLVDVEVTNADGQKVTLAQAFTFDVGDAGDSPAAVDELDGHDAEIKPDTPDEDLPITEGGVE